MLHSFPFRYFSLILLEQALRLLNYLYEEISRAVFRELYGEQMSKALKPASNLVQNKIRFFFFKSLQRTVVRINAKKWTQNENWGLVTQKMSQVSYPHIYI